MHVIQIRIFFNGHFPIFKIYKLLHLQELNSIQQCKK